MLEVPRGAFWGLGPVPCFLPSRYGNLRRRDEEEFQERQKEATPLPLQYPTAFAWAGGVIKPPHFAVCCCAGGVGLPIEPPLLPPSVSWNARASRSD